MARVTVEDCLEKINNRFALVLLVTKRAKQLLKGAKPALNLEYDFGNKYIVSALREVASNRVHYEAKLSSEDVISQIEGDLKR